jgi:hypothetical protein
VRIMNACVGKVAAVRTMAGSIAAHALLRDIGMVSTSGRTDETVRRLYDIREYIIALYKLDEAAVYLPAILEEDLRVCATCGLGGGATNKPLLEYVTQCESAHNRMKCVGLDFMPVSWLCAQCIAIPVYMIRTSACRATRRNARWGRWDTRAMNLSGRPCSTYQRARAIS